MNNISFVFFGTSEFSIHVLNALAEKNLLPVAVVTFPDKPVGRKMITTPNPVKLWAQKMSDAGLATTIEVIEVTSFKDETALIQLKNLQAQVFVVASFGKILPASVIYMPKFKTLNVHPSLLPKLRGPAPIQEAILHESETGVSIMALDEKMDEGPILKTQVSHVGLSTHPYSEVEATLGHEGGILLAEVLPLWIKGEIKETPQDNSLATYTKKIEKSDADISNDDPVTAYKKILAYETWPRARLGDLIITSAHLENNELIIDTVIPAGKKEMPYQDYLRGNK